MTTYFIVSLVAIIIAGFAMAAYGREETPAGFAFAIALGGSGAYLSGHLHGEDLILTGIAFVGCLILATALHRISN